MIGEQIKEVFKMIRVDVIASIRSDPLLFLYFDHIDGCGWKGLRRRNIKSEKRRGSSTYLAPISY